MAIPFALLALRRLPALEAAAPSTSLPYARPAPSERKTKQAARATTVRAAPAGAAGGLRRVKRERSGRKKKGGDDDFEYAEFTDSEEDAGAMEGSGSESLDAGAIDDESDDDGGSDSPRAGRKRGRGAAAGGTSTQKSKRQRTASTKLLHGAADTAVAAAAAAFLAPAPSGQDGSEQAYSGGGYGAYSSGYGAASGSAGAAAGDEGAGYGAAEAGEAGALAGGAAPADVAAMELATRLGLVIKAVIQWQDNDRIMGSLKSNFKKQVRAFKAHCTRLHYRSHQHTEWRLIAWSSCTLLTTTLGAKACGYNMLVDRLVARLWIPHPCNQACHHPLVSHSQVSKVAVPDYNNYVAPQDEMWLEKIQGKARKKGYQSVFEFKQDMRKISDNAAKYNRSSTAQLRTPPLADLAEQMLAYCDQQLAAQGAALKDWSALAQVGVPQMVSPLRPDSSSCL